MKPTKLPSGAWRCQVYMGKSPDGKRIYKSVTRPSRSECLLEASKLAKHHHETERDSSTLTLEEAIDKYIKLKDGILSPCTIRSYDSLKRNHFQQLMPIQLRNINKNIIQQAINDETKHCKPKTVKNAYGLLTAVLSQFTDAIPQNITLKQPEDREVNTLTDDQMRLLIKELQGDRSEIPLLCAMFLGLRRSEIMALQHEDYDPETNIISITKAMVPDRNDEFVVKSPKTRKGRRKISVPPYLADRLKECIAKGEPFFNVQPGRPYKRLQQLCEKLNLPKISLHDLRHQNASIMLALNIQDKYAMERGGWSSDKVMKDIYQHTMDQQRQAVDAIMTEYFNKLTDDLGKKDH